MTSAFGTFTIRLGICLTVLALQLAPLSAAAVPGDVLSELKISDTAGGFTGVLDNLDFFGRSVAALGDLDGDGVDDVAVGSAGDDDGGDGSGAVWILFLNPDGTVKNEQKISRTSGGFGGVLSGGSDFGHRLAPLGDLDGDGVIDLAVSAPLDDTNGNNRGAIFILFLNTDGTVKDEQRIDDVVGSFGGLLDDGDEFGSGLSAIGDLDKNGTTELAVGARRDDGFTTNMGGAWILYLLPDGTVHHQQKINDLEGGFGSGLGLADSFGTSTTGLGDLDGDGVPEIAVGAPLDDDDGNNAGAVWILFLNEDGTVKLKTKITGFAGAADQFGVSLGRPGDLNGDGFPELAVGASGDAGGGAGRGAVYVLSLDSAGGATLLQKISDTSGGLLAPLQDLDNFGISVAGIANFDGLGGGGLLVGAVGDGDGGIRRGAVYLLEIEGSSLVCGNAVLDPVEECDDGNTTDFDGCTAVCEVEDELEIFGIASTAGLLSVEIDGVTVDVAVSAGDTPTVLASLLATAINASPALAALGTNAQSVAGVVYSNGRFASGEFTGDGLSISINPGRVLGSQKISDTQGGFTGTLGDFDLFGTSLASLGDLNGDGVGDLAVGVVGTEFVGNDAFPRGAVWVIFMNPDGTVDAHQKIDDTQGGFTGTIGTINGFGASIASLGDLNGDGIGDLAVGDFIDVDEGERGAVWVLFLNADGTVNTHQKISGTQGGFTGTLERFDSFGISVASLGDLNGDGIGDLAVGAEGDDDGGASFSDRGAVWVLFLNADGTVNAHQKISDTEGGFSGILDLDDEFGVSVASPGDLNGDGIGDLAVGARESNFGGDALGAVWVLFLNPDGTVNTHQKISDTEGGFSGILELFDSFGIAVASLGDLDGDGIGDLAVGARGDDDDANGSPGSTNRGAVWVLFLNADGTVNTHQKISDTHGGFSGILPGDQFGSSVASLGDLNGDGIGDLAVGARGDNDGGVDRGAVWVLSLDSAAPPVCGDNLIRPPETCDDGNVSSGDGCYQTCQIEDETLFSGIAQGGTITAEVSGTVVLIVTTAGQDATMVASSLADAINPTPALQIQGISSLALTNRVVTNGTFDSVTSNDPGIFVPEPGLLIMLAAGILGLTALGKGPRRPGGAYLSE